MFVKNKMTTNPYTLTPDATIADAMDLMRSKNIRRVPVVKDGKLVGIITERKLMEVSPSPATSLSVFEINYLLAKTKISTVMSKDLITVSQNSLLEEAALKMREHDIGGLLVVDGDKLVGVITETDIFDSFIEIMGLRDNGSRIAIRISDDKPGILAKLAKIIADFGFNIQHLALNRDDVIVRVNSTNIDELLAALKNNGFVVTHVAISK